VDAEVEDVLDVLEDVLEDVLDCEVDSKEGRPASPAPDSAFLTGGMEVSSVAFSDITKFETSQERGQETGLGSGQCGTMPNPPVTRKVTMWDKRFFYTFLNQKRNATRINSTNIRYFQGKT
jgi:hypothetical protein